MCSLSSSKKPGTLKNKRACPIIKYMPEQKSYSDTEQIPFGLPDSAAFHMMDDLPHELSERAQFFQAYIERAVQKSILSEQVCKHIIDACPDLIGAIDRDFKLLTFNTAYQAEIVRVFGKKIEVGMCLLDVLARLPDEQAKALELGGQALRGERYTSIVEFVDSNQVRIFREVFSSPILDGNRQIIGAFFIIRDVTPRKQAEEESRHLNAELVGLAQKLEKEQTAFAEAREMNSRLEQMNKVLSDFISIVSHEFRTTLTSIQGFSELLRDEEFSPAEVKDYATDINIDATRLHRMISELLDLERMKSGKMTLRLSLIDLNTILVDGIEHIRPKASEHTFNLCLREELPQIQGDWDKLTQVVVNLLSNAVKYSPNGGDITVSSGIEGDEIHLAIKDSGVGIPEEALDKIFIPYSRIESEMTHYIQGTGLGLTIVQEIVRMHGGRVWAESQEGAGATFHVTLPRNFSPSPAQVSSPAR